MAGAIEVLPAVALLDHRLQIFEPDDAILHRVLDDGAGEAGREVVGVQLRRRRSSAAMARPLVTTEIASAVESVPLGDFSLVLPSAVTPLRSSRKTVTTRRISSSAGFSAGSSSARPSWATRRSTISTSSSMRRRARAG